MTIVAFDGKTLAADSLVTQAGARIGNMRKIVRAPDGSLAGAAGGIGPAAAFLAWAAGGFPKRRPWQACEVDEFEGIVIRPDGRVEAFDELLMPALIEARVHAIGSGWKFALGAMDAGASARRAVLIAMRRDPDCGGRPQTLTLRRS